MSYYRKNVLWQSSDGRWNLGFYDYANNDKNYDGEYEDDDYDEEWNTEYNDNFHWVSTGNATEDDAFNSWTGSNPGSSAVVPYEENEEIVAHLDNRAAMLYEDIYNSQDPFFSYHQHKGYNGPKKNISIPILAEEYYGEKEKELLDTLNETVYHNTDKVKILGNKLEQYEKKISDGLISISDEDTDKINEHKNRYADNLAQKIKDYQDQNSLMRKRGYPQRLNNDIINTIKKEIDATRKSISNNINSSLDNTTGQKGNSATRNNNIGGNTVGKYHINPETGRPNKCTASKRSCPFGGHENHYDNKDSARKAYELKMEKNSIITFTK